MNGNSNSSVGNSGIDDWLLSCLLSGEDVLLCFALLDEVLAFAPLDAEEEASLSACFASAWDDCVPEALFEDDGCALFSPLPLLL